MNEPSIKCTPSISLNSISGPSRNGFRVFPPSSCGGYVRRDSMFSLGGRVLSPNVSAHTSFDDSDDGGSRLPCSPLSTGVTCKTPGSQPDSPPHFFNSSPRNKPRRSISSVSNNARRRSVTMTPLKLSSSICNSNSAGRGEMSNPVSGTSPTLMAPSSESQTPCKLRRISITGSPSGNATPRSPLSAVLTGMPNNVLEFLEGMPWLENAPLDIKTKIAGVAQVRLIHQGEMIIRKSEQAKAIFFVARGLVEVVSEDGEVIFAELGEGSIFGEIGILFDMPRTSSCRAASNLLLLAVKKEEFLSIISEQAELKERIVEEAKSRLKIVNNKSLSGAPVGKDFQMSSLAESLLMCQGFCRLDRQVINQVSLLMESCTYRQSEEILNSTVDKTYENFFVVMNGEIEIASYATNDLDIELSRDVYSTGSMFGNIVSFFPDDPLPEDNGVFPRVVRAGTACELLKLPTELFRDYLTGHDDVAAILLDDLGFTSSLPVTLSMEVGPDEEEEDPMGSS